VSIAFDTHGIRTIEISGIVSNLHILKVGIAHFVWDNRTYSGTFSGFQASILRIKLLLGYVDILPNFYGINIVDVSIWNTFRNKLLLHTPSVYYAWDDAIAGVYKSFLSIPEVVHVDIVKEDWEDLWVAKAMFCSANILGRIIEIVTPWMPPDEPAAQFNYGKIRVEGKIQFNDGAYAPNLVRTVEWSINYWARGFWTKLFRAQHYS